MELGFRQGEKGDECPCCRGCKYLAIGVIVAVGATWERARAFVRPAYAAAKSTVQPEALSHSASSGRNTGRNLVLY